MLRKWQNIVDIMGEVLGVPSAIITRVDPPEIEVLTASKTPGNPYTGGLTVTMAGHYCQTVIEKNRRLEVNNAPEEKDWKEAPEIKYGIIAYLGYPLLWPGGEIFGTICVLDSSENRFGPIYNQVLEQFRDLVETHLDLLEKVNELEDRNRELTVKEERLQETIKAKDVLMREINHRVKNNLAMINSLISLEQDRFREDPIVSLLENLRNRISTIGMVHEKLYKSRDLINIEAPQFFHDIISILLESVSDLSNEPRLKIDIEEASLAAETIIPLGLMATELITNSLKYGSRENVLVVSIALSIKNGTGLLEVRDNGPGLQDDFEVMSDSSMGLQLVTLLVDQLYGNLEYTNEGGACFRITFPLEDTE